MVFSSLVFLTWFLPALFLVLVVVPNRRHNAVLLLASLLFYAVGSGRFVVVLIVTSLLDWWLVRAMARASDPGRSRLLRNASLVLNVGLLGVFKYLGWISEVAAGISTAFGVDSTPVIELALPIGISFFTFQRISYTIDVWRGVVEPLERARDHLLFVGLFPQLIAGPIVRFSEIRDQLRHRTIRTPAVAAGAARFALGLAKKVLVADQVAGVVDVVFANAGTVSTSQAWVGALAYTVQIYFDFSAYSDMAIGLGRCLGFDFPENFARPYSAVSMTDFWRRWHMTLSRWFRDYVYIPLGGSRGSAGRTYWNLWVVFLLTGAWHGAAWTFVIWGAYHGAVLTVERFVGLRETEDRLGGVRAAWRRAVTFLLVVLGWVVFRADTMADAGAVYAAMVGFGGAGSAAVQFSLTRTAAIALVAGGMTAVLPGSFVAGRELERPGSRAGVARLATVGALLPAGVLVAAAGTFSPFLYFRF